jgi:hypothetical protein
MMCDTFHKGFVLNVTLDEFRLLTKVILWCACSWLRMPLKSRSWPHSTRASTTLRAEEHTGQCCVCAASSIH